MSKLDDLCAIKVMEYRIPELAENCALGTYWRHHGDMETLIYFTPSTSLDDALVCLERAAGGAHWQLTKRPADSLFNCWFIDIPKNPDKIFDGCAHTAALAMCLCSLRAMGVPESEISLAMEDK